ncbi:phosphate ABC transporter permease PstA [Agromyces sp. Soil535]|uniref:phosphate ABC transporter permease PstA n=1 Tax=Agromyces sp. Soil535 TaxID=1736390 RepID=UPI000A4C6136|nr:phosphate ABC transporter permease PstA [Agromyces sp. Soil535]
MTETTTTDEAHAPAPMPEASADVADTTVVIGHVTVHPPLRPPSTFKPSTAAHRTKLPPPPDSTAAPEPRRSIGRLRLSDVIRLFGALAAAVALTWWIFTQLLPLEGPLGFIVVAYGLFLVFFATLVSLDDSGPAVRDRVMSALVHSIAALMLLALAVVIIFTVVRGLDALPHLNFFTQDMGAAGPLDPLSVGGILHAVVGTLIMITIALLISVPLGILCALFLTEVPGAYARFVRTIVEAMTALPSIVAGLFIYATVVLLLGFDRSGFAAALAITVMMLPIIIRSADVVLRLVPGNLKEASFALGSSQWRTVWNVTLPTARSGLTTAIILGTARGIGETSPVLLTAGMTTYFNANPFSGPMISLPLATFSFVRSPEPTMIARGFGTAVVLMVLVLLLFILARVIGGRGPGRLSPRQHRRRAAASRADVQRYAIRRHARLSTASSALAAGGVDPVSDDEPRRTTGEENG